MQNINNNYSAGGIERAKNLTQKQRIEIAKQGARARWDKDMPQIIAAGEIKLGDVIIPCYVDENGERIISGRGMQESLHLVDFKEPNKQKPGSRMTRLLNNKVLNPLFLKDKSPDHFLPKKRRWQGRIIHGFNCEMLADICDVMLSARSQGLLKMGRQEIVAAQCELLLRGFARVGIAALIDEATGYQNIRPADALKTYLEQMLNKEIASWVKQFPNEYYENIYNLKGWDWQGMNKNRYSVVGHYTKNLIYDRIAPGLTNELQKRNPKNEKGIREHKHHQWLNDDNGKKLLAQQLHTILVIQRACLKKEKNRWNEFLKMMDELLPKQKHIQLPKLQMINEISSNE